MSPEVPAAPGTRSERDQPCPEAGCARMNTWANRKRAKIFDFAFRTLFSPLKFSQNLTLFRCLHECKEGRIFFAALPTREHQAF
ncbi:MAG: hypothetical protein C0507_13955 [Cyanobacteria bacterium PR.3.49]|nr:hypothetical protein [Cyanobacteria bacterium PR.3.49]